MNSTFSDKTLHVESIDIQSTFTSWHYGEKDTGNLLGTIRSLDKLGVTSLNCTENQAIIVHDESLHCEWGLIGREGWAIIDDTTDYALDPVYWWAGKNKDQVDIYLLAHGYNYKAALRDYSLIGGKVPLLPRSALGIWWSRWYDISARDTKKIMNDYQTRFLPLDVFILDMDWHTKEYWGGYSWDRRLFPHPEDIMSFVHDNNLIVGLNIHDADGVGSNEEQHDAMARVLGLDPKTCGTIPFNMMNTSYAYALEDVVLLALEKSGVDLFWIDWQQGGKKGGLAGDKQNPTIWTDRLRATDHLRRGVNKRGFTLARWGGLGNHRYQVGFSADVNGVNWSNLAYQPYFTLTASNVLYGYVSHDLVGPRTIMDYELMTRWIQWGAYSPIFRTHDRGMSWGKCADEATNVCSPIEVWNVPKVNYEMNAAAMRERASLTPYLYTAARELYDTGLSLIRPMYYEFPHSSMAYAATALGAYPQYFFGPDMIVSPVVHAIDKELTKGTFMAKQAVWVPPGLWYSSCTGALVNGGDESSSSEGIIIDKSWDEFQIPVYVRAGAIIPKIPLTVGNTLGVAQRQYTSLDFWIYPGKTQYSTRVYEDDGLTLDYIDKNAFAYTTLSYVRDPALQSMSIQLQTQGSYPSLPAQRTYTVRILSALPPTMVVVNGVTLSYARIPQQPNTWWYDGSNFALVVELASVSVQQVTTIKIKWNENVEDSFFSGLRGMWQHGSWCKEDLDEAKLTPGVDGVNQKYLMQLEAVSETLSYLAGVDYSAFMTELRGIRALFANSLAEIKAASITAARLHYCEALFASAQN
eukprot:TRINITY_DN4082_c0_g1_i1.p1 TRINITY_DN4082_c0_g1~~TRINITY_DN4082_c0_g1_i1.p1  ORF type:complete len:921 (+),score=210.99 TRINITY_DN4082_c0_g1_i1:343-2763(+)